MSSQFTSSSLTFPNSNVRIKPVEGYPTLNWTESGVTATEKFLIQTGDVMQFIYDIMPPVDQELLQYRAPSLNASFGDFPLAASSLTFEPQDVGLPGNPFGRDKRSGVAVKTYCDNYYVTIQYSVTKDPSTGDDGETPQDPSSSESFTDHTMTGGGMVQTISPKEVTVASEDLPAGGLEQDENGGVDNPDADPKTNADLLQPIVIGIPTVEHIIHYKATAIKDWSKWTEALGQVNSRQMKTYENTPLADAEPETLLFAGFSASQQRTLVVNSEGVNEKAVIKWTREAHITQRRILDGGKVRGWNHVYAGDDQGWRYALRTVKNAKPRPPYKTTNFDTLLENDAT